MNKKALRQELRQALLGISPAERHERSSAACTRLLALPEYQQSQTIMIFLSTADEVDTSPIALSAWAAGKRVTAPKVAYDQRRMMPVEIESLSTDITLDAMGIREPMSGMPTPISEIDLLVVPGLGFDECGNRLGRGQGFYDRFLAHREFRAFTCAIAFDEQVRAALPRDEHDRSVDMLVTPARTLRFSERARQGKAL